MCSYTRLLARGSLFGGVETVVSRLNILIREEHGLTNIRSKGDFKSVYISLGSALYKALSRQIVKCICSALHFKSPRFSSCSSWFLFSSLHFLLNSNINSVAECLERGLVQVPKKHQSSKRM